MGTWVDPRDHIADWFLEGTVREMGVHRIGMMFKCYPHDYYFIVSLFIIILRSVFS